jgi:hypothetical protein
MIHLGFFAALLPAALVERQLHSKHYRSSDIGATACAVSQTALPLRPAQALVCHFIGENVRKSRHARVKLPPYCCSILELSIFAEWGLVIADTRRGAFRVTTIEPSGRRRQR